MMLKLIAIIFLVLQSWTLKAQNLDNNPEHPLSAQAQLIPFQVGTEQIAQLEVKISLPKEYRAYEDQFKLEIKNPNGFQISNISISPTHESYDKFTQKTKKFVTDSATLKAAVQIAKNIPEGEQKFILALTYQACTNSFCLFPKTLPLDVHFKITETSDGAKSPSFFEMSFKDISEQGLVWTFLFVFAFGFLTSFTPCVYPMIPITLAILGREAHVRSRVQTFMVSVFYVAGIAATFSALGVFAASTGMLFGSFMSSPWILGFISIVFFMMGLSMLGVFELQVPQFIRDGFLAKLQTHGYLGAFVSGLLAGIIASPCVGPVLVGVLTFVAQTKSLWLGFWLLFTYALGMGLIFLGLGLSTTLTKHLPKSGGWTNKVKVFFAVLMFGASIYYLDQILVTSKVIKTSVFNPSFYSERGSSKAFGLDLIDWQKYSDQILIDAKRSGKPVIIDFRADWCAACLEMEEKTFTVQSIQLLSKNFVMVKFDATQGSPELEQLKERFNVVGLPTIIFISASGQWNQALTLTEFEDAGRFEERMKKALLPSKD